MRDSDSLDEVDRQILDRLKRNGREPAASIAKAVSLSGPAVQRRIDRLEKRGVIRGYTVAINSDKIETSVDAYIQLTFDGKTDVNEALGRLIELPEVREAVMIAGRPDGLLRVRSRSTSDLGRLAMQLRADDEITSTVTLVVVGRWWHGTAHGKSG